MKTKTGKDKHYEFCCISVATLMQVKFIVTFYSYYWTLNNYLQKVVAVCCAMA